MSSARDTAAKRRRAEELGRRDVNEKNKARHRKRNDLMVEQARTRAAKAPPAPLPDEVLRFLEDDCSLFFFGSLDFLESLGFLLGPFGLSLGLLVLLWLRASPCPVGPILGSRPRGGPAHFHFQISAAKAFASFCSASHAGGGRLIGYARNRSRPRQTSSSTAMTSSSTRWTTSRITPSRSE